MNDDGTVMDCYPTKTLRNLAMRKTRPTLLNGTVPPPQAPQPRCPASRVPDAEGGGAAHRRRQEARTPIRLAGCDHDPRRFSARPARLRAVRPDLGPDRSLAWDDPCASPKERHPKRAAARRRGDALAPGAQKAGRRRPL